MGQNSTVIFWGAGATASLGMRTTDRQGAFIAKLTGAHSDTQENRLPERVAAALDKSNREPWHSVLSDLVMILGDKPDSDSHIDSVDNEHLEAMARHWRPGASESELRQRIMDLRIVYDWPALKAVVKICPGIQTGKFQINDLFNVMDMHAPLGHGFRAEEGRFLDARRLLGAKTALKMILHAMFYIDYQICLQDNARTLQQYYDFAVALGRRMQAQGRSFSSGFDTPAFIRGDVAFVSLNYDPIALWTQFAANRDLNICPAVPHVASPCVPLQLFHDMGHFIPSRRIEPRGRPALWYPMNEASAQRLNEDATNAAQRIRLTKFLFPHGSLCWRECPDCGKLSAYHGEEWNVLSRSLIPPPPLKGFETSSTYPEEKLNELDKKARDEERKAWADGRVDARACLHCGTLTMTQHTQTVMQSSFKQVPPSFIDEIQRDLRALVMQADHIVFMGYSLPRDDVSYRSFFAARRQRRREQSLSPVRCTIINWDANHSGWLGPNDARLEDFATDTPVRSALDIFGTDNVRYYGGGVPDVFLDGSGNVAESKLEHLLTWPEA